jgi:group I intron endonuclease
MVIYKTTNLLNGKFYVGKDTKNDPNYLGSGHILKRSIKKYGRHNFKKEIIEVCSSEEHLNERERYWITELKCRERIDCYNIGEGGIGGDNITYNPNKPKFLEKMKSVTGGVNNGMYGKRHKPESKDKLKEKAVDRFSRQWHIDRYGEDEGLKKYEARNVNLKTNRLASDNPAYIYVNKDDMVNFIISSPECDQKELSKHLGVGTTCLYRKYKMYFNCKNLKEVKQIIC